MYLLVELICLLESCDVFVGRVVMYLLVELICLLVELICLLVEL